MSDIKKWMKIIESVDAVLADQPSVNKHFKANDTVTVSPKVGGGVGRFVQYTQEGALVDIKGITRELASDDFSELTRDTETGNDWFHVTQDPNTQGSMNDKPEFRSGDLVKIADVYGAVIGPGFGVFVAYSTDGKESIVNFDGKEISVPTANVGAVLEQNAKDNFGETDNDGNLSPMSLGSQNVVKIEEPAMDQKSEFSKWMKSIEEALSDEVKVDEEILEQGSCGCGAWNCPDCFPDENNDLNALQGQQIPATIIIGQPQQDVQQEPQQDGIGMAGTHPVGDDTFDHQEDDEVDVTTLPQADGNGEFEVEFDEEGDESFTELSSNKLPRAQGGGVKLGDIVQKFVPVDKAGEESPLSTGGELEEDGFGEDPSELIQQIANMQAMGLSKASHSYTEDELAGLPPVKLKSIHQEVMGGVQEATDGPKPTKPKQKSHLDDLDDVLNPRQAEPLAHYDNPDDGEFNDTMDRPEDSPTPHMPRASAADTRARTANMNPSELMRDMMGRINPNAGGDEPELDNEPVDQENAVVARTARDVPAAISNAMQVAGVQMPEWHTVNNLPGFRQRNVRGMGRQIFGMFTRTPLEQIQTIANVDGQGPNTDAEMRAVASFLMRNAEDMGDVELSHGDAIPGYAPDVKEYRINGVRFHIVRDPMGQYIYAYPDADSTTNQNTGRLGGQGGAGPAQGRLPGAMPRLREESEQMIKLTITEAIKFDDIIRDGLREISESTELDESSLSKLIGKQQGGQRLVQWLHRKHKLGNMADLQPQPFSERMLWKEFKRNPDNFVVVSATNGVAGIKPYEQMIKDRTAAAAKKGKTYDPGGDSTLQYQIIAFTDDGQQVDPSLLQPRPEAGEEREEDPTVMKARMGKISGKDTQNPDNVFNLLADQIGTLRTVYLAASGVERGKMAQRADLKKGSEDMPQEEAVKAVFNRVKPVLKKLAMQAKSTLMKRIQRYNEGGNFEGAQKLAAAGSKLTQFLATLDTSGEVNIDSGWGSSTRDFSNQIKKALADAAGAPVGSDSYKKYLNAAAKGNAVALRPVLDALRDNLVGLQ